MTAARISAALAAALVSTGAVAITDPADPVVAERLGGGSFTESGDLILVADRTDETLICNFVTDLGGTWDATQFRYGDREFVRSTGTDALPCAV
ncbi:hypothetical protein [Nocardia tengchongensis]|uniref:hypothetical protein n=1 Tax=Nocardia tengchongensis TaxID=2055889 RepID=UPI0036AAA37B